MVLNLTKKSCLLFILVSLLLTGLLGGQLYANEQIPSLLGKWKGRYSFSVAETGFTSLQATFILHIYEQSDKNFKGRIDGAIDGSRYSKNVSGTIDENNKNICANTSDGVTYAGYFVTDSIIRLYSFEKDKKTRIIKYLLRKIHDP
jgi:hypothetical protein